jgi:S-adenosylmethionine/arginine decarboxylase-like enzyme
MANAQERIGLVHRHFIFDAELNEKLDFSNRYEITTNLIQTLIKKLGMEALDQLQIYDAKDINYPGWSFIQPITTSHISGHYFEEENNLSHLHMDIYSCKLFECTDVIEILNKNFSIFTWYGYWLNRDLVKGNRNAFRIDKEEFLNGSF